MEKNSALETVIIDKLKSRFNQNLTETAETYGMLTLTVKKEAVIEILTFLYNDPELAFQFLTTLCGVHYPDTTPPVLGVVYHLHSFAHNTRIRVKTFTQDLEHPTFPTLTGLFSAADWMERETYDFFGIVFTGHPNLIRILNAEDITYFPMRKEFPLEEESREDKNDTMFGRQE